MVLGEEMRGVFNLAEGLIMVLVGIGFRVLVWDPLLAPVLYWLNPIVGKLLTSLPIILIWWLVRRKVYAWLKQKGWY